MKFLSWLANCLYISVILLPLEREPGDGEERPAGTSEDGEKERPVSPNAPSDDSKVDANKHKKHLVRKYSMYSDVWTLLND